MIEHPDYWELPVLGLTVTRCVIDYRFSFDLDQGNALVCLTSFLLSTTTGIYDLDPEKDITELGIALSIFQKQIEDARAYKNGDLDILFSDGSRIQARADPHFEAWEMVGNGGLRFISMPGGELAIWLPKFPKGTRMTDLPIDDSRDSQHQIAQIISVIHQSVPFEVDGATLSPPMILASTFVPMQGWNRGKIESRLSITLPQEMCDLWNKAAQLRLFVDNNYAQRGIVIWTPEKVTESQEEVTQMLGDELLPTDIIIGEFLGSAELILLRCDPPLFDFGYVVIIDPLNRRRQWPVAAFSITEFLVGLLRANGEKYWERNASNISPL